jgi:hypothetical protein
MNIQIAVARWRRADTNTFICQTDMHRVGICRGVNSDRLDAQFLTGSEHAKSDFATIGYEDLLKHALAASSGFVK